MADHNTCVHINSFQALSVMKFHVLTLLSYEMYVFVCGWASAVWTTHTNTTGGGTPRSTVNQKTTLCMRHEKEYINFLFLS